MPLCGNKNISFDEIEIIKRNKKKILKIIDLKKIKTLSKYQKNKIKKDLKLITKKRKTF